MTTWQDTPTIIIPRARCPHCGDMTPPHIYRSYAGGDGSMTRRCICRSCSRKYAILIDPDVEPLILPAIGGAALPVE